MGATKFYTIRRLFDTPNDLPKRDGTCLTVACEEMALKVFQNFFGRTFKTMRDVLQHHTPGENLSKEENMRWAALTTVLVDVGIATGLFYGQKFKVTDPKALAVLAHIKKTLKAKGTLKFLPKTA
jgi:hypothetical protein